MTNDQARAGQAIAAIDAFLSDSLVFLTPPKGKLRDTWVGRGGASVGLVSVCHGTTLKDPPVDDRGRLRVDWSRGVFEGGASVPMPHPRGISGGGLWRLLPVPKDVVWRPDACAKLIGVATSFSVDTEFVVPVSKWRPWLLTLVGE
jgi:hypothetical protein